MNEKHPENCEHCGVELDREWDNERRVWFCGNCYKAVGVSCPFCGGEGFVEEAEYEADWVNCSDELIVCPECDGEGWTAHPSFQ